MNEHFFFNDTLDGISFSVSGKVKTEDAAKVERLRNNKTSTIKSAQITFDDSIFLSESFALLSCENGGSITQKDNEDIFNTSNEVNEDTKLPVSSANNLYDSDYCVDAGQKEQISETNLTINTTKNESDGDDEFRSVTNQQASQNYKKYKLSDWNLPELILHKYQKRNITEMFRWQCECLENEDILEKNKNLVYSAPTSAGKTLVSEILALKTLLERNRKVIFILPFVSVVREKMFYFQDILGSSGICVEGFMGSYNPPGGFQKVQMAICTIEKANSLINRLLEEDKLSEIGAVIVDEMHLIGDYSRGYLLELLLTKVNFMCLKRVDVNIQIIGMSATLPNLNLLAEWLNAVLYTTNFRPIPLHEQCHVNGEIYDSAMTLIRKLPILKEIEADTDNILQLCLETIENSCSVLIFCPTKNWCENLAQQIAIAIRKLGSNTLETKYGQCLRQQLNPEYISEVLEQLKRCPVGLDKILCKTIAFGVAFHHAGLTMDERDIVEGAFRSGAIRILIATSTLSSGVNLPARRVIIRTPLFHGKPLDAMTYKQMIGRAGRMGKDSAGESLLICQKNDYKVAKELMSARMEPIESCLSGSGKLKRAILEVIASGVVSTPEDVTLFTACTLYANEEKSLKNPVDDALEFLKTHQFVRLQTSEDGSYKYIATSLGKACLSSSMPPEEGLALFTELEKARQCFVLDTELHLVYLVTPYSACNQWGNIDWMFFLELWEKLPANMKRVGDLVGIRESFLINASRGKIQSNTSKSYHDLQVHKRFYVSLALQDLVNEVPLNEVASKFNCSRGSLQSLQQSASTFAGMVTSFSKQLGWLNVEILISQFQDRLHFGVNRDLLDLMRLPVLNGPRARALYKAGIETLVQLASADREIVEDALHRMGPFESEKEREGETKHEAERRNKARTIWVTGKRGMTEREAADMLISDARRHLELEMGVRDAKWDKSECSNSDISTNESADLESSSSSNGTNLSAEKSGTVTNDKSIPPQAIKQKIDKEFEDLQTTENEPHTTTKNSESSINLNLTNNFGSYENIFDDSLIDSTSSTNLNCTKKSCTSPQMSVDAKISPNLNTSNNNKIKLNASPTTHQILLNWSNESLFEKSFESVTNITNKENIGNNKIESLIDCHPQIDDTSKIDSDTFLENAFNSSFTLQIPTSSNCNSPIQNRSIIESSTPTNTSSECVGSSQGNTEMLDTPLKRLAASRLLDTSTRKRKKLSLDVANSNTDGSCLENTPVKKKKVGNTRKSKSKTKNIDSMFVISQKSPRLNATYKIAEESNSVDLNNIEIINVCENKDLFKCFCKELLQQREIALSLGCVKVEINKPKIGSGAVNTNNHVNSKIPLSYENHQIVGIGVSWGGNVAYYIDFDSKLIGRKLKISLLKNVLSNRDLKAKIFDAKRQTKLLQSCLEIEVNVTLEDPKVADWLLDPEGEEKYLQTMVLKYATEAAKLSQLAGSYKGTGSIGLYLSSSITPRIRCSVEAVTVWHVTQSVLNKMAEQDMKLLHTYYVEMSSISILAKMEIDGFCVNKTELQKLADTLSEYCRHIEKKAYKLAGRNFSFNSSADVAKVIGIYKNNRRTSTSKQVLEQNDNPISSLVIQWRKINCTLSKMVYPFLTMIRNDRIHGTCVTFTSTGRINMHEPSLQTIPREFEYIHPDTGENISINCRKVFETTEGFVLISADYCQLELRLLAHLSKDKLLCKIMKTEEDVFRTIAAKLNDINEQEVTDQLRQRAKQICYGIIYGMGAKSLSEQLNSTEDEAKQFLNDFHNKYPSINVYINKVVMECKEEGYVETIAGRRRFLPNINHHHPATRSQAERQAVNTTIQGSAADIAKNAMVVIADHIREKFKTSRHKPKLILQLHDEFLYEVQEKYANTLAKIVKKCMENSVQLDIPFPVKIKRGKSWGSFKEMIL